VDSWPPTGPDDAPGGRYPTYPAPPPPSQAFGGYGQAPPYETPGGYGRPPPGYGPQPGYWMPPAPPFKGATLGRPPAGPGSLAEPWQRLVARLLDGVFLLPVIAVVIGVAVAVAAPHFGPLFPSTDNSSSSSNRTPGFVWLELTIVAASLVLGVLLLFYDAFCTVRWGRTPGKAVLHIRPLKADGRPLGWGPALGREAIYRLSGVVGIIGLLDVLWCLWDSERQCLHDKALSTIVVQD
jgi:uncharacterized RDD family membrane protein YckC